MAAAPLTQDVSVLTQQQFESQAADATQLPDSLTQNGFTQSRLSQPDYFTTQVSNVSHCVATSASSLTLMMGL